MTFRDLLTRAKRQLNPFETDTPLQFIAASIAAWFGLWLLLPNNTFGVTPAFEVLSRLIPENALGFGMLLMGVAQMFCTLSQQKLVTRLFALVAVFVWSLISYSIWISALPTTASVTYPHLVLLNAIIFVRQPNK